MVIRYAYLWRDEAMRGQEEGSKDRPAVIVLARKRSNEDTRVVVVPITHSRPRDDATAIEVPAPTARRLGLDDERSWIVTREANVFVWPGPDIRPAHLGRSGPEFAFGSLPAAMTNQVIAQIRANRDSREIGAVNRDAD